MSARVISVELLEKWIADEMEWSAPSGTHANMVLNKLKDVIGSGRLSPSPAPAEGWQPIETAPKDGSAVRLAWGPDDWTTAEGFFRDGNWVACPIFYKFSGGNPPYEYKEHILRDREAPIKWLPLPPAPERTKG